MVKNPFKNFTIAVTGDFGPQRTHEKMKQWIQVNGGTFSGEVTAQTTHLICSKEHFKKNVAMVQQAKNFKNVKIVSFDWLEDSLMKMTPKSHREYLMAPRAKAAAEAKAKKRAVRKENIKKGMEAFEKGCKEFEKDMFSDGYHIYADASTFKYDITLARANLVTNKNERYALKLYESHSIPHYYASYVKYSAPGTSTTATAAVAAVAEMLAPIGSSFDTAFGAFEKFFELKTKRAWEDRFEKRDHRVEEEEFVYVPPRGMVPPVADLEEDYRL